MELQQMKFTLVWIANENSLMKNILDVNPVYHSANNT